MRVDFFQVSLVMPNWQYVPSKIGSRNAPKLPSNPTIPRKIPEKSQQNPNVFVRRSRTVTNWPHHLEYVQKINNYGHVLLTCPCHTHILLDMHINSETPYNELPLLPLQQSFETIPVMQAAIRANRALAELKGIAQTIPNQSIFINTISLKEAQYSSEIENIITTTDELYQAFSVSDGKMTQSAKEVLQYRNALWQGFSQLKKRGILTTSVMNEIQATLLDNNAGIRSLPGTALKNAITGKIIYTPPVGKDVILDKLKNLETYIHSETVDPLIKMAIMHYQFESIHPYYDGNGRTGRILNVLYLIYEGLLDQPILYLSHYIIQHKEEYYRLLQNCTFKEDYEPWILYMLRGVEESAKESISKIKSIQLLMQETMAIIKEKLPKIYSKELVEVLFQQPYCKIKFLEDYGLAKRKTASEYLYQLEAIGVLESKKIGRETLFLNVRLFELFRG
ncbi:MAG: Fic family protein [Candidatus Margulisiibacteriota bacterium]